MISQRSLLLVPFAVAGLIAPIIVASCAFQSAATDAPRSPPVDAAGAPPPGAPPHPVSPGSPWTINSPDNRVVLEIALDGATGSLSYRILLDGKMVIDHTPIGLRTSLADFSNGLAFVAGTTRVVFERFRVPTGKRSAC